MWIVLISALSFVVALLSLKSAFPKRVWIKVWAAVSLTVVVVVLPAIIGPYRTELFWRLATVPVGIAFGIIGGFLAEIPIWIFLKRHKQTPQVPKNE
jgi:hypothetical protein